MTETGFSLTNHFDPAQGLSVMKTDLYEVSNRIPDFGIAYLRPMPGH